MNTFFIPREVGALEMVELIQGVRMGLGQYQNCKLLYTAHLKRFPFFYFWSHYEHLGVGVLRDEGTDEEDDDAANEEGEEEEIAEQEGENDEMVHMTQHNQNIDLPRQNLKK